MNQVRGVGVTQVVKDSPAEKAGMRKDDVILRIDGENINSVRKLNRLVSEIAPDQSVRVTVSRGGAEQEVTATIGKRNNSSIAGDLFCGRAEGLEMGRHAIRRSSSGKAQSSERRFCDNDGDLTFILRKQSPDWREHDGADQTARRLFWHRRWQRRAGDCR